MLVHNDRVLFNTNRMDYIYACSFRGCNMIDLAGVKSMRELEKQLEVRDKIKNRKGGAA